MTYLLNDYAAFLDAVFSDLTTLPFDISELQLDHLGYRTETNSEYDLVKNELLHLGKLVSEPLIKERRIGVFKLHTPLRYKHYEIEAIEVIAPTSTQHFNTGLEHAEFVIPCSAKELYLKYPKLIWNTNLLEREHNPELILELRNNIAVKFHKTSLLNAIQLSEK